MQNYFIPEIDKRVFVSNGGVEGVKSEQKYTNVLETIEYVPFTGILVHVKGGAHPKKGYPTPEAVFAINIVKTLTLEMLKILPFVAFFGKNKFLQSYNKVANRALDGYRMTEVYLCKTAYSVFLTVFGILRDLGVNERIALNFANNVAHIFEYDDAWRYRFQDVMSECFFVNLKENPIMEIKRLQVIHSLRDTESVNKKASKVIKMITILLLIPKFKRAFVNNVNLVNAKFDAADWYWVSQRNDYLFGGIPYEDRVKGLQLPLQVEL